MKLCRAFFSVCASMTVGSTMAQPAPTENPTDSPTLNPTDSPTDSPTLYPTDSPTLSPTLAPVEFPSLRPSRSDCEPPTIGCGFGMWNFHTCECQCVSAYCIDTTGACHRNVGCPGTNDFEGCTLDCPWFLDSAAGTCVSNETVPAGITAVYMSKGRCCRDQFVGADAIADCDALEVDISASSFESYWYPDWGNTETCKNDGKFPLYMQMNTNAYLYQNPVDCCARFYQHRYSDCLTEAILQVDGFPSVPYNNYLLYRGSYTLDETTCDGLIIFDDEQWGAWFLSMGFFAEVCKDFCKPGDRINVTSICGYSKARANVLDYEEYANFRRDLQTEDRDVVFELKVYTPTAEDAEVLLMILNYIMFNTTLQEDLQDLIDFFNNSPYPFQLSNPQFLQHYIFDRDGQQLAGTMYYPNWGKSETCVRDGKEPLYMRDQASTWLYDNLEDCCDRYYSYAKLTCMTLGASASSPIGASAAGSKVYYPDWEGGSSACLDDGDEPDYMAENREAWMYETVESCCARYFSWDMNDCVVNSGGSSSSGPVGSTRWYVKWVDFKCVQDCPLATAPSCGGLAESWDNSTNFATKLECCQSRLSWIPTTNCTAN